MKRKALCSPDPWDEFRQAVAGGEEGAIRRAFEKLYRSTKDAMVKFAYWCASRDHNPDLLPRFVLEPEDVVEEAYVELLRQCQQLRKDPKTWLLVVIRRKLGYDVARARREEKGKKDGQRQLNAWSRNSKVPSSISRTRRIALRKVVNSLPERMRAVIIALYYRDESIATTAGLLGITENTVVITKRRALKKLEGLITD